MTRVMVVWSVLGLVSAVVGCSSSSDGGVSGGSFTSVSSSQVLGSLSDADAQTFCMDLGKSSAFEAVTEFECRADGLLAALVTTDNTDASVQAACQSAYTDCVSSSGMLMCQNKPSTACMATVGEYESCVNDEAAAVKGASAQLPMCSALKAATLQATLEALPQTTSPSSCATVAQKCPEIGGMSAN